MLLCSFSLHHIDMIVEGDTEDNKGWFTGFYGHPVENLGYQSWNLLRRLSMESTEPRLFMGDFNKIMYSHEKQWGD